MVDVSQLRAIRAVFETGSITTAARRLGMSQPGLSRLLDRVEDELGARLFARGRTGATPTEEGWRALEFALQTLTAYDAFRATISAGTGAGSRSETLRIAASTTPGEYLLPEIASAFTSVHSGISVESLITDSAAVAGHVLSREFDAGFSGMNTAVGGLVYVPVARDEIVLAVPVSHRFAEMGEIDSLELEGERMLRRERGSGTYEVVAAVLERHGQSLPKGRSELTLGSTQAVVSAVDAGLGVGFVTTRAIEQHAPSRVMAVRITGAPVVRDLFMLYEAERRMSAGARMFVEFVEQRAARDEAQG
jgi:DNA-binding transcriptional LysR family regulator